MKKFAISFLVLFLALSTFGGTYIIPCCKMPYPEGGWSVDRQGVLGAKARGNTLRGDYDIPDSGIYYLWLRTLSFGQNWRKSSVCINDRDLGKAGDEKIIDASGAKPRTRLMWGRVPQSVILQEGIFSLRITAETPNSRVASLILTTDKNFVPPDDENALAGIEELISTSKREFSGKVELKIDLDKTMISYHVGEPIVFTVDPKCNDRTVDSGYVKYALRADYGFKEEKLVHCDGNPFQISAVLPRPGFVRLQAELLDSHYNSVISEDGARPIFYGGAGADIDQIPSLPEPADFDEFWLRQKDKLTALPLQPVLTSQGTSLDGRFEYFSVSAPCPGPGYKGEAPRPMTGILSKPVNAAKGSLPARLYLPGYGGRGGERTRCAVNENCITMSINAHGMDIGRDTAYYNAFEASRAGYALSDGADPENCYFNGMVLRLLRALEFIKSLPEWNGRDLEVHGSSQGGLHALWAAGLDDKVSFCEARIPWGCNMGETTLGLMGRDFVVLKYAPGREYYDPVNFAKRIKCPVNISRAGMGDYTCPPSGVARVYYNLQCPKEITWVQNSMHTEDFPLDATKVHMVGEKIVE